jgi:hypothetical protein
MKYLAGGGDLLRLDVPEAAALFGVDRRTIYRWARDRRVQLVAAAVVEVPAPALPVSARPPRTRVAPFVRLEGDELVGTSAAVAAALGVDRRTVERWVRLGKASSAGRVVHLPVGSGSWVHRSRARRGRVAALRRQLDLRPMSTVPRVRPVEVIDDDGVVVGPVEQVAAYLGLSVRTLRGLAGAIEVEGGVRVEAVPVVRSGRA